MSGITDEITEPRSRRRRDGSFSFLQVMTMVAIVLLAAVYMGETLFGHNSLEVLLSLQKQQKILDHKIKRISYENALLQKKYLELKAVTGDMTIEDDQ